MTDKTNVHIVGCLAVMCMYRYTIDKWAYHGNLSPIAAEMMDSWYPLQIREYDIISDIMKNTGTIHQTRLDLQTIMEMIESGTLEGEEKKAALEMVVSMNTLAEKLGREIRNASHTLNV